MTPEERSELAWQSTCEHCDLEFTQRPRGRRARFCSRACQVAALNARPDRKRRAPQGSQVRIPPEIHRRLRDEAEARGVSIQWLTVKLLTEAIDMLTPADEMRLTRGGPCLTPKEARDDPQGTPRAR